MKKIYEQIKTNPLFEKIGFSDFEKLIHCMDGNAQSYRKDEVILLAGNPVSAIGIVLCGSVQIWKEDSGGKQNLMAELQGGDIFAEVFACAGISHSPVTVTASADCEILYLNYRKIITTCSSACPFHIHLVENMLKLIAQKSLKLNQKIEIISKRTTRERLLAYFDILRQGKRHFTIPLSREELAAYLCVERSAMSAELSKMQRDGMIQYQRNEVKLTNIS